jgi:subtilisin family serine protease
MMVVFNLKGDTLEARIMELEALQQEIEQKGKERGIQVQVIHTLGLIDALAVLLPADDIVKALEFLQGLQTQGIVKGIFADRVATLDSLTPTSQQEASQGEDDDNENSKEQYSWALEQIDVPHVHRRMPNLTGAGVMVGILDTGIDSNHPDLTQNIGVVPIPPDLTQTMAVVSSPIALGFNTLPGGGWWQVSPPVSGGTSCADDHGHGTHIGGIIAAAKNSMGIVGVAPEAKLVAVKVLDHNAIGFLSNLINGLQALYDSNKIDNDPTNDIRLINMSLGFSSDSEPLSLAIGILHGEGAIMVASAGN